MDADRLSERMGSPHELARRAANELRLRTYAGRHPFVTFVAAPLPTAALILVGICLSMVLVLSVLPEGSSRDNYVPDWAAAVMQSIVWAMRYVPFMFGAVLFCHLAKRALHRPGWSFVACALIALSAGSFAVHLTLPTNGPGSGSLTMGFGFAAGASQLLQALAPLAVWAAYAGLGLRNRNPAAVA